MSNQNPLNPSPAAMMGVVPTGSGPGGGLVGGGGALGGPQPDLNMFNSEFMNNMTTSLEDFAGTADLFRTGPDGDINFERDFAQWFNPDDVGTLDMK
jgi:collagen type III alpha